MAPGLNIAAGLAQAQAAAAQVVATVEVTMTADGKVAAKCKVPNRQVMLMMMETAKLDLNTALVERDKAAAEPGIEVPNHGVLVVQ